MYWLGATVVAWAILSVVGLIWELFHATSAITILLAMSAGCFANWARNRTYHCAIDGPLFLVAGVLFLFRKFGVFQISAMMIWIPLFIGVAASFWLEWRLARQSCDAA
jgi:hypothetical protein